MAYLFVQFVPPQNQPDTSFHQKLYHVTDHIEKKADPQNNENQCKNTPRRADGMDLTISDRGYGDHRHVKRIQHRPILDQHIPSRTEGNQECGKQNNYDGVGRAIQNTFQICILR